MARESTQRVVVVRKAEGAVVRSTIVIKGTGEDDVKAPTAAGVAAVGIVLHGEKTGAPVDMVVHGRTRVVANEAASRHEQFGVAANGRATTVVAAGDYSLGRYLEAATAAGQVVDCFFDGPQEVTTALS